jgi:hypothetical protein
MSRSTTENKFGAAVRKALRESGAMVYPLIAGIGIPAAWPDVLVWSRVWDGLIELKALHTPVHPAQVEKLRQLNLIRPRCAVSYREVLDRRNGYWGRLYIYDLECKAIGGVSVAPGHLLHTLGDWRRELRSE